MFCIGTGLTPKPLFPPHHIVQMAADAHVYRHRLTPKVYLSLSSLLSLSLSLSPSISSLSLALSLSLSLSPTRSLALSLPHQHHQ